MRICADLHVSMQQPISAERTLQRTVPPYTGTTALRWREFVGKTFLPSILAVSQIFRCLLHAWHDLRLRSNIKGKALVNCSLRTRCNAVCGCLMKLEWSVSLSMPRTNAREDGICDMSSSNCPIRP